MTNWNKPTEVDVLTQAFPASVAHLMPDYDEIPEQFKRSWGTYWNRWQAKWFYYGLTKSDIPTPQDGIDLRIALGHLTAIQGSFEPKHEHKEAAVAYLASLWLQPP